MGLTLKTVVPVSLSCFALACGPMGLDPYADLGFDEDAPVGSDFTGDPSDEDQSSEGSDEENLGDDDQGYEEPTSDAELVDLWAVESADGSVIVQFEVFDPDGALEGGSLSVSWGDVTESFVVPDDLFTWDPSGASGVKIETNPCDRGSTLSMTGALVDGYGDEAGSLGTSISLSGWSAATSEVGDEGEAEDFGRFSPPAAMCGSIHTASNDGSSYTGDMDFVLFEAGASGNWEFSLQWDDASADYDIGLFDQWGVVLAASAEEGAVQPEVMSYRLTPGVSYFLGVFGWSGGSGDWTVEIQ